MTFGDIVTHARLKSHDLKHDEYLIENNKDYALII